MDSGIFTGLFGWGFRGLFSGLLRGKQIGLQVILRDSVICSHTVIHIEYTEHRTNQSAYRRLLSGLFRGIFSGLFRGLLRKVGSPKCYSMLIKSKL